MIAIRSTVFFILCNITGIVWGLCSPLCWLLPKQWRVRPMLWWVSMTLFNLRWICGVKTKVTNYNDGPIPRPAVILAKHQSTWETWYLQLVFHPLATILKKELLAIPFFGWGLALFRPITIDRSTRMQAAKQVRSKGIERLKQGQAVLIFPEGTRVPVGEYKPFARSGVDLAAAANVPIIPIAHNAGECWPAKRFLKYPGTIHVSIGKPIDTSTRNSRDIIKDVEQWILAEGKSSAVAVATCVDEDSVVKNNAGA